MGSGMVGSAMGDDSIELGNGRLVARSLRCVARRAETARRRKTGHFGRYDNVPLWLARRREQRRNLKTIA